MASLWRNSPLRTEVKDAANLVVRTDHHVEPLNYHWFYRHGLTQQISSNSNSYRCWFVTDPIPWAKIVPP